jgi:TPR repeat protein
VRKSWYARWIKGEAEPVVPVVVDWGSADAVAEAGDAAVQFAHAQRCQSDDSGSGRKEAAFAWYRRAAERGHGGARVALAMMYRRGEGVERDEGEALRWLRVAAGAGEPDAQYELGLTYYRASLWGRKLDDLDTKLEAYRWLRLAALQGVEGTEGAWEQACLRMTHDEIAAGNRAVESFSPAAG